MERVFGLPAGPLSVGLTIALALALGTVSVLAVRNLVFLKMGLRNIPRLRARSALIVVGLMLGTTIISCALLTGDTMASTVRSSVVETLGSTDETVTAGTDASIETGAAELTATKPYFDEAAVATVDAAVADLPVDGVTGAIIEPVAAQHVAAGRTEPRVTLFAPQAGRAEAFGITGLAGLGAGEVLLNRAAAAELGAGPDDTVAFLAGSRVVELRVAEVGGYHGLGTDDSGAVISLGAAQRFFERRGEINHVLVSNDGDETSGVGHSGVVEAALDDAVADLGLDAQPVKEDGLEAADATGDSFVQLFTTFGSFSMAAGVLLIFLIFVMLSAERRPEMGMARAVGIQRRHLVQTFLYEGATYDVAAAAAGAVLGIGVSWLMVRAVASAFTAEGLDLSYAVTGRSLLIAYALGVLLTLLVVTVSAWKVSRLNIVSAIRDLPETGDAAPRRRRWILPALGLLLGASMAASGATGQAYLPWMLGVSIVILSVVPMVELAGRGERLAYTAAGLFLLVWWMLPMSTFDAVFGEMSKDFSVWIASGLIVVVAATWLVTYNADVLLGLAARLASPFQGLRPIARMAVAYPLKSRFRTGVTMSMFMLVVFTLVTGSTIPTAFIRSFDDVERFGGGFDVRVTTAPAAAVPDVRDELPADVAGEITAAGAQSYVPIEASQDGAGRAPERYAVRGLDRAFLEHTTYELSAYATGYRTAAEVWAAMAEDPTLAVVDPFVAPRRNQWGAGVPPAFQLSGFYIEDGGFEPVPVTIHDPMSGESFGVKVIAVLSDSVPFQMAGISTSQALLEPLGERALPTVHHLDLGDATAAQRVAGAVEAALLARGAEAETYQELLDDAVGSSMTFIRMIQGFMALGLVVGVAALGVISARAVVERRQQLGMLRAIGFRSTLIRRGLLAETGIVALTAILVGTATGLLLSYNVIADTRSQGGYTNVTFGVAWLELALIFLAVIVAAVLTTLASSARATRLYPAEALRYR
jgi:putative ABC transport system permease protein